MYTSTCKDYDPIIGEYEYLKKNNLCTEKDVWKFIEKIIDIQINFTLDIKNIYAVQIMNVHVFSDRTRTSTTVSYTHLHAVYGETEFKMLLTVVFPVE